MAKSDDTHYSALAKVTLCGKEISFTGKNIKFTDLIELCDCPGCLDKYKRRLALLSK